MTTTTDAAPARTAPRRANGWLVAGAVLGALMTALGAVSFAGLVVRHTDTVAIELATVPRLVVHVGSGNVTVTGADTADIAATAKRTWSFAEPKIVTTERDGLVELGIDCGWVHAGYCDAAIELRVPRGTAVELRGSSGDVAVSGLRAPVTLTTDSGRVAVADVVGDVRAHADSGDVAVTDVTGDLDLSVDSGGIAVADAVAARVKARASSGDVRLDLREDPESVDARASSGAIAIRLPDSAGVAYLLDLHASSGSTSAQVRTDPASPRTITARTGSGDVEVAYR